MRRVVLMTLLLSLAGVFSARAASAEAAKYNLAAMDLQLRRECARGEFSGVVLVRAKGETIYQHVCGYADPVNGIAHTADTRFKIFSTSKFLTALTVMRMVELGQLRLDAPIAHYLRAVPPAWRRVTIRHLLNHTSGISDLTEAVGYDFRTDAPTAMATMLAQISPDQIKLATAPGEKFAYNNFGFELLANAVARVSKKPFADALKALVFEPAGMTTAKLEAPNIIGGHPVPVFDPSVAIGFNGSPAKLEQAYNLAFVQLGAGAVNASLADFVALDAALTAGKVIKPETYALMKRNAVNPSGKPDGNRFGLGIIMTYYDGVISEGHSGGNNGFNTNFDRFPDDDVMVISMSNLGFTKSWWIQSRVAAALKAARK